MGQKVTDEIRRQILELVERNVYADPDRVVCDLTAAGYTVGEVLACFSDIVERVAQLDREGRIAPLTSH